MIAYTCVCQIAIPSLSRLEFIDRYQNEVGKAACSKMLDEAGGPPLASTILRMCLYQRPKGGGGGGGGWFFSFKKGGIETADYCSL